jgi:hypothetical protein
MYFYISGISVIIGGFMNIAGFVAFIVTIGFFYFMGKAHSKLDR